MAQSLFRSCNEILKIHSTICAGLVAKLFSMSRSEASAAFGSRPRGGASRYVLAEGLATQQSFRAAQAPRGRPQKILLANPIATQFKQVLPRLMSVGTIKIVSRHAHTAATIEQQGSSTSRSILVGTSCLTPRLTITTPQAMSTTAHPC